MNRETGDIFFRLAPGDNDNVLVLAATMLEQ